MKKSLIMLLIFTFSLLAKEPTTMFMPPDREVTTSSEENTTTEESTQKKYYSYNDAFQIAQKERKIIMMTVVANNCPFCEKMEKEVVSESSVAEVLEDDFVLVKVNEDEEAVPFGMSRMMTPTYIFIDKTENILFMVPGSYTKDEFLEFLQQAKDKAKR
jgi:thioredoxin-related protein